MRFVLLREAGGLGDVVRTFPVARGLKERCPAARVEYVTLAGYEGLVRLSPDVDAVFTVSQRQRRRRDARPDPARHAYLGRFLDTDSPPRHQGHQGSGDPMVSSCLGGEAVRFVDLYCPAFRHEVETEGKVSLDRVELFCRAAGVEPSTPRLVVPSEETTRARMALGAFFLPVGRHGKLSRRPSVDGLAGRETERCAPAPEHVRLSPRERTCRRRRDNVTRKDGHRLENMTWTVGLAPYATHITRSWLGRERLVELARALVERARALGERGCRLVFLHSWKCRRPGRDEAQARDIGAYPALRLPWPALAAHVAECDLVISVDTGILHLAGAVGVPALGLFGPTSGEIMCRPYPAHQVLQALPVRLSPGATCSPPCYCRRSRGYSPDACGRTGCELLNRLTPGDVLAGIDRTWLGPAPI